MSNNGFIVNDDMFGAYVKIQTGASREMHVYKVIGRIGSNGYCDVPIMGCDKPILHSEIVPVLNVVHCGVCEDAVIRVALSDCEIVPLPNYPLTMEQLREMNGEPVWVESFIRGLTSHWAIVHGKFLSDGRFADDMERCLLSSDKNSGYGIAWLAYRRKPEGG